MPWQHNAISLHVDYEADLLAILRSYATLTLLTTPISWAWPFHSSPVQSTIPFHRSSPPNPNTPIVVHKDWRKLGWSMACSGGCGFYIITIFVQWQRPCKLGTKLAINRHHWCMPRLITSYAVCEKFVCEVQYIRACALIHMSPCGCTSRRLNADSVADGWMRMQ